MVTLLTTAIMATVMTMTVDIRATYRIQLNRDFTLFDAAAEVDYLHRLGISHLYLSPVFEAQPGSNHGYDVVDFNAVSDERGGEAGLLQLDEALAACGMKMILDIVPNHMAVSHHNPYWVDVLLHGRESQYWDLFDMRVADDAMIDIPTLGDRLERLVERGEVTYDPAAHVLRYYDKHFPLNDAARDAGGDIMAMMACQHYRLVPWTDVSERVSYRRFFDITDLIGVRVEDPDIYRLTHQKLFDLTGRLQSFGGVRVDHIDGLVDPAAYLAMLARDVQPVWVEKIVSREETLSQKWPVAGTTGYEFIDFANRAFVDADGFAALERYWQAYVEPSWADFDACVAQAKREALQKLFRAELARLAGDDGRALVFWTGLSVGLPVYRTYCDAAGWDDADRRWIDVAVRRARALFGDDFAAAEDRCLPRLLAPGDDTQLQLIKDWQQLSGPAMAKGLEDTAHYRYTPLAALNEVGCEAALNEGQALDFARLSPGALKATSTHDSKRSEDVRHRLYGLADCVDDWIGFYEQAARIGARFKTDLGGVPHPKAAVDYFFCQAVVGSWPLAGDIDDDYRHRLADYMVKAGREAKQETSWNAPDTDYEAALTRFVDGVLSDDDFIAHVRAFMPRIERAGAIASLAVLALKILSPGIPDFYQGTDQWMFSLVDPDNRRAVDYAGQRAMLAELDGLSGDALWQRLCGSWRDGAVKMWLTRTLLQLRPVSGDFTPLAVRGERAGHILAWRYGDLFVVAPRAAGALPPAEDGRLGIAPDAWGDTVIDFDGRDRLHDRLCDRVIGGDDLLPGRLLRDLPLAVLGTV